MCSDFGKFHHDTNILNSILYKYSWLLLVTKCIKEFLERVFTRKAAVMTEPKKDLMIVLSYFGKRFRQIDTRINRVMINELGHCNFWIVSRTKFNLISFIIFKNKIPVVLRCGIVYKFNCNVCSATYYSKTKRPFKSRICEELGVWAVTAKRVKGGNNSFIN